MKPCPRCGNPVPEGARFCPSCGLAIGAVDAPREERRIVTVLFADLVGFTAFSDTRDPEDVKRIVDRAFEGLAEIVTVYGGHVDKIVGDEIMAVFGAPQAHEDDPERAMRCALEMQRSLARYSEQLESERGLTMAMRVGVNTGEVVAGVIGGVDTYTVVGDAVNVASRLVKAAEPGRILAGPATRAATERVIEYRDLPPLTVRGKAEPLNVSEAVCERTEPLPERAGRAAVPLVGRDPELSILENVAAVVGRDRRPATVTILGDAGMGKSRLVAEFASRLRETRVVWGRSLPYGTATPSFAIEEMVRSALGISAEDPIAARKHIAEQLAPLGLSGEVE
ncbi:MAG: adenylate/guanylate cyclase domain-containing protein, partial [Actinomycetota bacterium]